MSKVTRTSAATGQTDGALVSEQGCAAFGVSSITTSVSMTPQIELDDGTWVNITLHGADTIAALTAVGTTIVTGLPPGSRVRGDVTAVSGAATVHVRT